jgi:hypothetical protein
MKESQFFDLSQLLSCQGFFRSKLLKTCKQFNCLLPMLLAALSWFLDKFSLQIGATETCKQFNCLIQFFPCLSCSFPSLGLQIWTIDKQLYCFSFSSFFLMIFWLVYLIVMAESSFLKSTGVFNTLLFKI